MNKKLLIPVITAVLLALGINLEQLGIDLDALLGDQQQPTTQQRDNQSGTAASDVFTTKKSSDDVKQYRPGKKWSDTRPAVNLHHIFEGEINRKSKPVGYHSRPGGIDPDTARIVRVRDKPNRHGVYTANIEVRDGNQWKQKFSSFFPDSMTEQQVVDAVLKAYKNSKNKKQQPWQGPSGLGFDIQGYTLSRGDINTAFPVYKRN